MADVHLSQVTKRFGKVLAMDQISLAVHSGEVVALLGPSGCGKTTTMRTIAGLETPNAGNIYIAQHDMQGIPSHKRAVGMVFQDYALFPHLSIQDNIAFGLKMRKVASTTVRSRVHDVLKLVHLADLPGIEQRYPHQLSGGQRQRVALARSLVTAPQVLLLDEPFGALDKKLRESMQVEVRLLQQQLGITTIFVTHDQEEALTLADRIAVMRDGRIEQMGTPHEVYESPRSLFVADFIGVSNFFSGNVEAEYEGGLLLRTVHGMPIWFKPPLRQPLAVGDTVQLALRPEKVTMLPCDDTAMPYAPFATVQHIVYLGTVTHYYTRTMQGEEIIIYAQNQDMGHRSPVAVGDVMSLSWKPEHLLVLEAD